MQRLQGTNLLVSTCLKQTGLSWISYFSQILGTALPGFRSCNPPWLRLSQNWDYEPLRKQSLSPWQVCHLCPLHPAWPWAWPVSQWWVRFLKGGSTQDRLWSPGISSQGRTLGGCGKRGWWTFTPRLWNSLSPHSVCKKSPNLLAALLPLPDLSLKQ